MDKLSNSEDVKRFLRGLGLRIDEAVVRQVINVLSGKVQHSLYSLYAWRTDKPAPICGKGSVSKIKKFYDAGKLQPYLDYLSDSLTSGEAKAEGDFDLSKYTTDIDTDHFDKPGTPTQPILPTPQLFLEVSEPSFGNSGDSGWPQSNDSMLWLKILCNFRPTATMLVESVKLDIAGEEPIPADDWKSDEINISEMPYLYFPMAKSVAPGQHNIRLIAFAEGRWWTSKPFSVDVPKR